MSEALWTELEKLDVLRERMGIGYEEARAALNLAKGDVVKALDNFEKTRDGGEPDWDFVERGRGIWDSVKDKLGSFNNTTVSLKKHDNTILSLSAPLGLALAYTIWRKPGLRILALAGAVGAAINHYELEVGSVDKSSYDDDAFNFAADEMDEEF
ncbi:MAG: DUF4342 domain-containing protein [Desulfosporosinus sp.]|nr:DUF4342 domain-containing protein [Desulfosporosinus sp.]